MTIQWHGPHLVETRDFSEIARRGSIASDMIDYIAAGPRHHPMAFPTWADAQSYLSRPGNRAPVAPEIWEQELKQ